MLLIIGNHFAVHSGFPFLRGDASLNILWLRFIEAGARVGVDSFILISGYFMISSASFKTSKVIRLWGQMFFYSYVIYLIFRFSGLGTKETYGVVQACLPVTFNQWWFASAYFLLLLTSPFINRLLNSLDQKQYLGLIFMLFILWCVIPTFSLTTLGCNEYLWLVFVYSLGGYIRKYGMLTRLPAVKLILLSLACYLLNYLSIVISRVLYPGGAVKVFSIELQSLAMLVISVLLFLGFTKIRLKHSRVINFIASTTFGIYLIHENPNIRQFLWKTLLDNKSRIDSDTLIPFSVIVIVCVFIVCMIIEIMRKFIIEKPFLPLIEKAAKFIDSKTEKYRI